MMRHTLLGLSAIVLIAGSGLRASGSGTAISGDYVEARTAEVFAGGCIMGSEGEPSGREAILAWHVKDGQMNGVPLDGLSIVAVVAADTASACTRLAGPRRAS